MTINGNQLGKAYKEIISSAKFTINPKDDNQQVQSIPEGFQIIGENLQPNAEQTIQYETILEYKDQSQRPPY
jgi:hypothetical protein